MTTSKNYLGRCKDCDYALFATSADIKAADNAVAGGPAVNVGNGQIMGRCTNGHRWFALSAVKGTYSEKHQCDSRCLNAKGFNCTCSCGGANHGRGHAVTVSRVSAEPTWVPTELGKQVSREVRAELRKPQSGHLGEVGKRITGEVTLQFKQRSANSIIHRFATDQGDIILWFRPTWVTDVIDFELGGRYTIRAKVKKHEDHPTFGKSTIVTYVEEV